jgi:hypothetical protein
MGWSIGFDAHWNRDIGYGVPAVCDHPSCDKEIDRGLAYVCGGEPYGGESGCGLYFCPEHLHYLTLKGPQRCERCCKKRKPFVPKPEALKWLYFKMTDPSWEQWRVENGLTREQIEAA